MDNNTIAERLNEYAREVEGEGATVYRVRAYRRAADAVRALDRPVAEVVAEQGRAGLEAIPGIGKSLAYTIEGLARSGEFRTIRPADGQREPERLLTSLPGVGARTAEVLRDRLGIGTIEELGRAAHQGRLTEAGIGPKRLRGLMDALAGRLQHDEVPEPVQGGAGGRGPAGRRLGLPRAGGPGAPADADPVALQPGAGAVAADLADGARRLALPGAVLQHRPGAPAGPHP